VLQLEMFFAGKTGAPVTILPYKTYGQGNSRHETFQLQKHEQFFQGTELPKKSALTTLHDVNNQGNLLKITKNA